MERQSLSIAESGCRFYFARSARKEAFIAIYHLSIKIISRGKGKSAVAAAAYRSGEKITNQYDGLTHDYTRKGGVSYTEILLPDHAPQEYFARSALWNAVEKIEKNCNSQLAREIELALPKELNSQQQIELARDYCRKFFVSAGMCADICIHDKGDGNPHAHIMLTMRPIQPDGSWAAKSRKEYILDEDGERIILPSGLFKTQKVNTIDWNEQTKAEEWRAGWADCVNRFLEQSDHVERIDHRSYERQGIEQIPTVHLGVAAFQMEKRGIRTERGDLNREIEVTNQRLRQLKARISKLQSWLKEESANAEPPTLADVVQGILSQQGQTDKSGRYQAISNLKAAANMLNFLTTNNIKDLAGLEEKVHSMYGKQIDIRDKLKAAERRLKVLDEHIEQADTYMQFREIYRQYRQQKPKQQEAFAKSHRMEITLCEAAERYLKGIMNGKTTLPTKAWRAERDKLTVERNRLNREYVSLKDEVKEVEQIRKSVYSIMREETHRTEPTRKQDMER